MPTLPATMIRVLTPFAPLFSKRVFQHVQVLVAGAILAPGGRTVSSALRARGLDQHKRFHRYHRVLSRLRLDATLYEPAPPRRPPQIGRPRIKGERLPNLSVVAEDLSTIWKPTKIANWYGSEDRTVEIASQTAAWYSTGLFTVPLRWVLIRDPKEEFKPQALLCTDLDADPEEILRWFGMHWRLEVTFQEMRRHLGFESQRQWSDIAIQRTTPALLGLFSLVTLLAHRRMRQAAGALRQAAWYRKRHPTFCDALAMVRKEMWAQEEQTFYGLPSATDTIKVPRASVERLTDAVCYAA